MIYSLFQSLMSLILAGVACYALFSNQWLKRRPRVQKALFGTFMGLLVLLLGLQTVFIPGTGVPLDARGGPLILAGYLGGPWGAVPAAVFAIISRALIGGPIMYAGIASMVSFVGFGLLLSFVVKPDRWPVVPTRAVLSFLTVIPFQQLIPASVIFGFSLIDSSFDRFLTNFKFVFAANVLSVLLSVVIIRVAWNLSENLTNNSKLAERLELASSVAKFGVLERYAKPGFIEVDAAFMRLHGWDSPAGVVSTADLMDQVADRDKEHLRATLKSLQTGTAATATDYFHVTLDDGTEKEMRGTWVRYLAPDGKYERTIGVHLDVTEMLQSRRETTQSREQLERTAANIPGAVFRGIIRDDGQIKLTYVSPGCQALWGIDDSTLLADPEPLKSLCHPDEQQVFLAKLADLARTGGQFTRRTRAILAGGESGWLDFRGLAQRDKSGDMVLDAIVLDTTQEILVQERLDHQTEIAHRAQKLESIGQLTGGIAHDFNNLLAVILGNLEMLRDDESDPEKVDRFDSAISATMRGADLTRSMLTFARQARLEPTTLDLNALVAETRRWAGRTLPETIALETSLMARLWPVKADPAATESALLNLILNARDAMGGQGRMTIETANINVEEGYVDGGGDALAAGRYVMLAVSDTGTGIDVRDQQSIFEPFYTTKGPGEGSGMGLAMVMGFMKQSGGTVQVYSEPGVGTTFKLYFPASEGASVGPDPTKPEVAASPAGGTILVVEDESEVLKVIETSLKREGYDVLSASNGDEALGLFQDQSGIALVVTDIVMPGKLQGTDLARHIRRTHPDCPMIFMSGYASEATVHGNGLSASDIRLMKPVPMANLLRAVARALGEVSEGQH